MHTQVKLRSQQSGAALLVAMIMLLVITVIAVSTMGTARLELQMAGNQQFSLLAFQAAQSAIESRIADGAFSTAAVDETKTYSLESEMSATADAVLNFTAATDVPAGGYSLGAGFQAYHFRIDVEASAPRDAVSEQVQGFYIVGPGGS